MDPGDRELALTARDLLTKVYRPGLHEVAAAARLADGAIVTGVHVEASQGRASVCAEGGVASAAAARQAGIVALVAVLRRPDGAAYYLIEPCGVCAELLADHHPAAAIWVGDQGQPVRIQAADLLRYRVSRQRRVEP
jgi:cytidine deaminase